MTGQIVHIEIPADDPTQASEFWGPLFGWSFEAFPGSPAEYLMARLGESQGAALTNMEPGKRGMRTYFEVDDIDQGVARVGELGGKADTKQPVPGMGWFSVCHDPHGNEFGLWQTDPAATMPTG